jgi:hypothetical protein
MALRRQHGAGDVTRAPSPHRTSDARYAPMGLIRLRLGQRRERRGVGRHPEACLQLRHEEPQVAEESLTVSTAARPNGSTHIERDQVYARARVHETTITTVMAAMTYCGSGGGGGGGGGGGMAAVAVTTTIVVSTGGNRNDSSPAGSRSGSPTTSPWATDALAAASTSATRTSAASRRATPPSGTRTHRQAASCPHPQACTIDAS